MGVTYLCMMCATLTIPDSRATFRRTIYNPLLVPMPLVIATMMTHVVSLVGMLVPVPEVTMRPVLLLEATVLVMAPASGRCHTTSFALHRQAGLGPTRVQQ